jgi:WD40 repeat protein
VWDEESGQLHRELERFGAAPVMATFLSADGQQPRLVVGSFSGHLRVRDPEAGSLLHRLDGHTDSITALACIASSSAAPHHPRLVSASYDGTAKVWDGETGERLADLQGHEGWVVCVAVWKEHEGGHDRIATAGVLSRFKVWDGETFTLLHELGSGAGVTQLLPYESAEGPHRLLVGLRGGLQGEGLQVWDPEEGRLLHDGINRGSPLNESGEGRQLLAGNSWGTAVSTLANPATIKGPSPSSTCGTWGRPLRRLRKVRRCGRRTSRVG